MRAVCVLCLLACSLCPAWAFHDVYYTGMQCMRCNASYYCPGRDRIPCPENSLSHGADLASGIDDCVCIAGYLRTGDVCVHGEAGAGYYKDGMFVSCVVNKRTYVERPGSADLCVCVPGFRTNALGVCVECPHGSYSAAANSTECQDCPALSSHVVMGSSNVTDCVCSPGAYMPSVSENSVTCAACVGGTAKAGPGNGACATCANNTFSNGTGATACLSCHAQSVAPGGSDFRDDCLCLPGFESSGNVSCVACVTGKNKAATSNALCGLCGTSLFQNATGQSFCHTCGVHSVTVPTRRNCLCTHGYTSNPPFSTESAPVCVACSQNFYKSGFSQNECIACGTFMQSPPASGLQSHCLCNQGFRFTGSFTTCTACEAGTYKNTVSNGPNDCQACPSHSLSPSNSTALGACACNAGFTPGPLQVGCAPCGPGLFKEQPGGDDCDSCAEGKYNPNLNATKCLDCYDNSASLAGSDALADCECDPGHVLFADTCSGCAVGKFDNGETEQCSDCVGGTYTDQPGRTVCAECGSDSASHDTPHVACQCNRGFSLGDGGCVGCAADYYKDGTGNQACVTCQPDSQSAGSATSQSDCVCNKGYHQEGESTCVACATGKFTDTLDASVCVGCGSGKFANTVAQSVCLSCWDDSGHDDTYTGCLCNDGYTPGDGDSCGPCGSNTFKDAQSNAFCSSCRDDSESTPGAVNANDCKCVAGRFLDGDVCEPCARGFFKEGVGNAMCTRCETSFVTRDPGSTTEALCVCPPGQYKDVLCEACPDNHIKASFSDEACTPCRVNSKRPTGAPADAQARCECDPGFYESTGPGGELACAICPAGTFSAAPGSAECSPCEPNTFSGAGSPGCEDCGDFSSTHGESGRVDCQCVVGYARVDGPECELCATGKFKEDHANVHCSPCQACGSGEQVLHACGSENGIVCVTCMASSSTLGLERTEEGLCNCDVGFELVGGACAQCVAGMFKGNTNNLLPCEPCAPFTFAPSQGASACAPCRANCAGEAVPSYVSGECAVTADISCSVCSVCGPGSFNNPLCGPGHANNRQDSVCTLCEPGTFCPGNGGRVVCTSNSSSVEGSVGVLACVCLGGFYKVDGACVLCPLNDYCYDDLQHDCPLHSYTLHKGSDSIADCLCRDGYFRSVTPDAVICELCTVNDYCFDDDRINCQDDLMTSPHGSSSASNCTCASGYYNNENNTECLACGPDTYCLHGVQNPCGVDEWTQGDSLSEQCWCRPGLHPDENGWCVPCSTKQFCEGDGTPSECPANSTTSGPGATSVSGCLCDPGFGFSGPPARCIGCGGGTVKVLPGNEACAACASCGLSLFIFAVCIPHVDTVCDACNGCLADNQYTSSPCTETQNSVCSECVPCVAGLEYEHSECEDWRNRVCLPIEQSSDMCAVGQYRGGHAATRDSECLPCKYLDREFEGHTLHVAASRGLRYNDAQSCNATCLGNSMLVNTSNQALGCVSCETGNVLLKVFDPLSDNCHFECRAGYTRVTLADGSEDCYDPVLHSSTVNEFGHNFSVTDFSRTGDASVFRILHKGVGFFMIVVGRGLPVNCRSSCCFQDLWLASSLHMMGLEAWPASTACVPRATLAHVETGNVLSFTIPDAILEQVAQCEWSGVSRECALRVSLIDMHTHRVASRSLSVRTTHSMSYMFSSNELHYIPLEQFDVDLILAHRLPGGDRIFQLHTRARGPALIMHTRIPNMQLVALTDLPACDRLLFGAATLVSESSTLAVLPGQQLSAVSYWRAAAGVEIVKALYTLLADSDNSVVMDIGAVRNVSALVAQCTPPVLSVVYQAGAVRVAFGMGRDEVHRMTPVPPEAPTRGELGTLVSFLVQSTRAVNASVRFSTVLAAYGNSPGTITDMGGQWASTMVARSNDARRSRDFTPGFKTWCLQRPAECQYEYIRNGTQHGNMHIMLSCSVDVRHRARQWLETSFGVVRDGGHVEALCDSMAENAAYAPAVVMVNTMKFLYRGNRLWNIYQNFSALDTRTFLWTDFSIVS